MNNRLKPLAWAMFGAGLAGVTTAGALDLPWFKSKPEQTAVANAPAMLTAPVQTNAALPAGATPNFRAIVQQSAPAVVGVTVEGLRKVSNGDSDDEGDGGNAIPPQLRRFFRGMPGGEMPGNPGNQAFRGQGSGFIVTADGLVLTNAHVVKDAKTVTVRLSDRREYVAKVLGFDAATDIAVLRIAASGLPTVRLGDANALMVGDPVLAIGAPFGLEQSATAGIVSAKGRSLPGDAFVPFIQTDAAVNPGNSGGPLFDGSGNVVGINSQIYSRSGGYQGLSFAIPINVALKVRDQIVATGRAEHARLGVIVQDLNQNLAESFGLPKPDGALVAQVDAKSPAAGAGLKAGDVILSIDGMALTHSGALSSRIGLSNPGEKVHLNVWRDHAAREIDVTLGRVGSEREASASAAVGNEPGKLGLALRPLAQGERAQAQVEHGMVVQGVEGAAARAGLQVGDVVLAINGRPVDSIDDLRQVLQRKPKSVALLVWRDGERLFVPVPLG